MRPILALLLLYLHSTFAAPVRTAYIDSHLDVHVVTRTRKNVQLTKNHSASEIKMSPDKNTVVWLVLEYVNDTGERSHGGKLMVYRNGKLKSISCGPFIRAIWFWQGGKNLAVECGGLHFAGVEYLYDLDTLRVIETFNQADRDAAAEPPWSGERVE